MNRRLVLLGLAILAAALVGLWRPWQRPGFAGRTRTIVLVTIDTLRRDHVGAHHAGSPAPTPNLDALAARGLRFDDARTPVPLTLPAHVTMLAGLPPAATGVRLNSSGRLAPRESRPYALLPEVLREEGWRTGAFVSASPLARRYGLDQGFEVYDDEGSEDETGLAYARRAGVDTVDRALRWVRSLRTDEPLFLWVHLFDPHAPYPGLRYPGGVAAADAAVGVLLEGLDSAERERPAVLVTSDHGEALGEHGERTHGLLLGDAVLRVPFLLAGPGIEPGVRTDPVDVADVGPTLAGLAGARRPGASGTRPWEGLDLLDRVAPAGRIRVAEGLFAHHRFRHAQVSAAVSPAGETLVDLGGGRLLHLRPAEPGRDQDPPGSAERFAQARALGEVLAAYRSAEQADLISAGAAPGGGYGQAGRASPFLPDEENGRLPSPYERVHAYAALDRWKERSTVLPPEESARRIREMIDKDPGNPEMRFWLGRVLEKGGDLAGAEAAYLRAFELGRKDADTLTLAAGVNALGREREMLDRLRRLGTEVVWDCECHLLEAYLLHELGEDATEACRNALRLCTGPRDRAKYDRSVSKGACAPAPPPR